jgi:hypothetical protein
MSHMIGGHQIEFVVRDRADLGALEVVPEIDGVPLTTLIGGYERHRGLPPAGRPYGGLVPAFYRFGKMNRHFRGGTTETFGPATPVLGCNCGDWCCWSLMCRIGVTDYEVTWDSFTQPHRPGVDYRGFGPFRFARAGYEDALGDLALCLT